MEAVFSYLREQTRGNLLPWPVQTAAAEQFGLSLATIERLALEKGLLPARYQRNRNMITTAEQLRLFQSTVAVIGCGGLGGHILEALARLGVGHLVAVDPDVFEEHNLNRQLLCTPALLGQPKVTAAAERLAQINPAVSLSPVHAPFARRSAGDLLSGVHVVVDALDCIAVRLELAECCAALGLPLVHGAIAGWYGQVTTQLPGDDTLARTYTQAGQGIEKELGNPSFTPALVASLEAAEVCKILLGRGTLLRRRTLTIDLLEMDFFTTEA
jgi:molybdopterin/thiamine biosynthesis adenylyltransferase